MSLALCYWFFSWGVGRVVYKAQEILWPLPVANNEQTLLLSLYTEYTRIMKSQSRSAQKMLSTLKDNKRAGFTKRHIQRTLHYVCGSCDTPLSTAPHNPCEVLLECTTPTYIVKNLWLIQTRNTQFEETLCSNSCEYDKAMLLLYIKYSFILSFVPFSC